VQGVIEPVAVKAVFDHLQLPNIAAVLQALPEIMRGLAVTAKQKDAKFGCGDSVLMTLAIWDDATRRAYGFVIGNETCSPVVKGHLEPFKLVKMLHYVQQLGNFEFEGVDHSDPAQFDPVVDGGRLLDAQRLDPFGEDGMEFCGIAGQGILTTISAAGIGYKVLRTWEDKVGERIPVPASGVDGKPSMAPGGKMGAAPKNRGDKCELASGGQGGRNSGLIGYLSQRRTQECLGASNVEALPVDDTPAAQGRNGVEDTSLRLRPRLRAQQRVHRSR
jgi:hypothetical protein